MKGIATLPGYPPTVFTGPYRWSPYPLAITTPWSNARFYLVFGRFKCLLRRADDNAIAFFARSESTSLWPTW